MTIWCFYHDDLDGKCAAAIVSKIYDGEEVSFVQVNYTKTPDLSKIVMGDVVWIVDYAFSDPKVMDLLLTKVRPDSIRWFDHHKTTLEKYDDPRYKVIPGSRSIEYAGCMLVWRYGYFGSKEAPMAVQFTEDQDLFRFKFEEDTKHFVSGMGVMDPAPESDIWQKLLSDDTTVMADILFKGEVIQEYWKQHNKEFVARHGYERKYLDYSVCVINKPNPSMGAFESVRYDYDIFAGWVYNGDVYTVSLYSATVDVSGLAKKYGGGGHKGAAGFTYKVLPDWLG